MSKRIYRYELGIGEPVKFYLQGKPLAFAAPGDKPEFWAEQDNGIAPATIGLIAVGTGWDIPREYRYLLTAPRNEHGHVWHLYELEAS